MTAFEQTTMANCGRPLGKEERANAFRETVWGKLELMGLSKWKEEKTTEGVDRRRVTSKESPKPPPPKAPTYSRDPASPSHGERRK